ncbi:MAG: PSD1 and planctomycete cytochrome C domain-containing protein [Planctomycetota bacterium]|nr:PSD1 and planctomycete cytochrome C domain-containing protein [Planctomycetota bacterium]
MENTKISFRREIQPIFAEHCGKCHGLDSSTRKSGLRLDVRDQALQGGDSERPAIIPNKPEKSHLIERVSATDEDLLMPPLGEKNPLSKEQIDALATWIQQGAEYDAHWAFERPRKIPLRADLDHPAKAHPVDAIVAEKLGQGNLQLSPPAPPDILCRRVYLDLIGLPPSPAELDAFGRDGLEATVDRLLADERFGEKWAQHWLDVARYSDTNGYEKDMSREQWIWRNWVINAINADMPYDQFIIEQLAGDLLPNATQEQIIATGFLRNSMINEEGAIVAEQFRMVEMFDRMDCVGKAVLGLTIQCAQCHSHKFDPITHDEYYGLFAFFNNSFEARSNVYSPAKLQEIAAIQQVIGAIEDGVREQKPDWKNEISAWEQQVLAKEPEWNVLKSIELGSVSGLNHPRQLDDGSLIMLGHSSAEFFVVAEPDVMGVTGVRLEVLTHGDLPSRGPGRDRVGSWDITEFEVLTKSPDDKEWKALELAEATADFSQALEETKDSKQRRGPVSLMIDKVKESRWTADRGLERRNQASVAVVRLASPVDVPLGTHIKFVLHMTQMVGCCRISITTAEAPAAQPVDYQAILAMKRAPEERTDADNATIFSAWAKTLPGNESRATSIDEQWKRFPSADTSVLHLAERTGPYRRVSHLLGRGAWDQPQQAVQPHALSILHEFPETKRSDRLALARWLTSKESPLTARVAVNRAWQVIFGEGLVSNAEDFGTRTPVPEYLELLDWLAVDLMESQWSHKALLRRIVTSKVYQQTSTVDAERFRQDPRNRLLARGPRFRVDAEVVRDLALSVSGLMTQKVGGPSIIPPVPKNVLDYNFVVPNFWTPAEGAERYRRAIYVFRKRSMPDPVLSNFDAPNGDMACARRPRSNTPLAALTGLNETVFVEAARALALRILREGGAGVEDRINYGFRLCTSRYPNEAEQRAITGLLSSQRVRIAEGWLNPREITTGDAGKLPDLPPDTTPQDAAAWTLVARVLLNLDETVSKN